MRINMGIAYALTFAALLSACSTADDPAYFQTAGVVPPSNVCPVDPRSFGNAEPVPDITEGNGCGIRNGYRVYDVSNVTLNPAATIRCELADTFNDWLNNTVQPHAKSIYGQRVVSLKILSSYSCRPRNNVSGAKLSEHGMANAIDVGSFTLADGHEIVVLTDWYGGSSADQSFLRAVRGEACGPFHTVLGPGSDAEHKNHFHLDLQHERSGGPYCH